ncbi:unnamed protein product [Tilletia controversa]|nr:unnamed protein product [Tilletia controversa]
MTAISSPSSTHDIVKRAIMDDIDRVHLPGCSASRSFLLADDLGCFTGLAASNSARRFSTSTFFHLGIDFGTGDQVHLFGGPSPYPHIYFFFQQQLAHIRTTRLHCALLHGIRHSHARSSAHCFSHVLTPRLRCFVRYTCGSTTAPATLQTHFGTDFGTAACDSIPEGHFHSGIDIGTGDRHPLIYLFDLPQLAHIFNLASPSLPAHAAVSAVISTSFSSSGSSSNTTAPASPVNASSSPQALLATVKPACSVAPTPYGALLSNLRARQPVPATKASTSMRVDLDASSSHSSRHISPLQRSSGPLEDATKVLSRKTFGRATAVGDNDAAFTLPSGAAVEMRSGTMMVSKHAVPITVNTRCRSEEAGHGDAIAPSNDTSIASPAAPSLADEEETSRPRGSPSMFREVRAFEKTGTRPSHHTHLSGKANSAQIAVSRVRNAWLDARRVVLDAGLTTHLVDAFTASALVLKFFFGPSTPSLLLCLHSRITSSTSRPI